MTETWRGTITEVRASRQKPWAVSWRFGRYARRVAASADIDGEAVGRVLAAVSDAVAAITADASLERGLNKLVTAAQDPAGATYAAVGVPEYEGDTFARFLPVGMSDEPAGPLGPAPPPSAVMPSLKPPSRRLDAPRRLTPLRPSPPRRSRDAGEIHRSRNPGVAGHGRARARRAVRGRVREAAPSEAPRVALEDRKSVV